MFYLKHNGKKLTIEADNVYTQCPRCGREFPVDLAEVFPDGEIDLYGTSIYCKQCGERTRKASERRVNAGRTKNEQRENIRKAGNQSREEAMRKRRKTKGPCGIFPA